MSSGPVCYKVEHKPRWRVLVRKANYSTFNGGHRTPSAYSSVGCLECRRHWRTKAKYVDRLPTATSAEFASTWREHVESNEKGTEAGNGSNG